MPATYTKPAKVPRWNDDLTNNSEPSEGKKDAGWLIDEIPPSSYENWRSNLVGAWLKYFDERFDDAAAGDDFVVNHPGSGDAFIKLTKVTAAALEFFDPASAIDQMAIQKSSSGDENQLVFVRDSSDWFATQAWDKASNSLYIGLNKSAQYDDVAGDYSYQFARTGDLRGRVYTGGPTTGPDLWLENPNTGGGTGTRFRLEQGAPSAGKWGFWTETYGGASQQEHFYLDDASPHTVFADTEVLRPTTNGLGYLGNSSYYWDSLYVENLYHKDQAYWHGVLNSTTQITNAGVIITPDTVVDSNNMTVTTKQLKTTKKGRYLVTLNLQLSNPTSTPPYYDLEARLRLNGTTTLAIVRYSINSTNPYRSIHLSAIVDLDPITDYVDAYAQTLTAAKTVDAFASYTSMVATLIKQNP